MARVAAMVAVAMAVARVAAARAADAAGEWGRAGVPCPVEQAEHRAEIRKCATLPLSRIGRRRTSLRGAAPRPAQMRVWKLKVGLDAWSIQ